MMPKKNPDEKVLLMKDLDGDPCQESFGYDIMVGMMLHLSRHVKLGITMLGHASSRFNFCPNKSHDIELKKIGIYLKVKKRFGFYPWKNLGYQ